MADHGVASVRGKGRGATSTEAKQSHPAMITRTMQTTT